MKFFISLLLIAILSYAACLYFPWWSIAIVAFAVNLLIYQKPFLAWVSGFLAIFILWIAISFFLSNNNEHVLAQKISILILKMESPALLILITGLIGALVSGFAALAGNYWRSIFIRK